MPEEVIDIVNNNDEVIDKSTKQKSHEKGLPHRVVAILVINKNQILVNQRHDSGLFDHSVGGHVKSRETYTKAAVREAKEEIDLHIKESDIQYIDHYLITSKKDQYTTRHWFSVYKINVDDNFIPKPQEGEVISLFFKNIKEIENEMRKKPTLYNNGFISSMNAYLQKNNKNFKLIPYH